MVDGIEQIHIQRITGEGSTGVDDSVAVESPLTIILNNRELVTLMCTPCDLDCLAVGFLSSEGIINSRDEIEKMTVDARRGVVRLDTREAKQFADDMAFKRLITSGCGGASLFYRGADVQNLGKVTAQARISPGEVLDLVHQFQHRSEIFRLTGSIHSAALTSNSEIIVFAEDIGRHNAIDKIFGRCILESIPVENRLVVTSGRISSEVLLKVTKRGIPIVISSAAPTSLSVKMAADLGVTVIGFVRGKRMNVYANDWRLSVNES